MRSFLLLISIPVIYSSHKAQNQTDVIITYDGHVEATQHTTRQPTTEHYKTTKVTTKTTETTEKTFEYPVEEEEVIFIPNDKAIHRVEEEFYKGPMRIGDLIEKTDISDIMKKATEPPNETIHPNHILFISGKNAEHEEQPQKTASEKHMESGQKETKKLKEKKLDCSNLDCANRLNSVCGGKIENYQWKYRLFLNECYYRKVNCNFNHEENRYKLVKKSHCHTVAIHLPERPKKQESYYYPQGYTTTHSPPKENLDMRRSFSSRRSLNMGLDGQFCSHPCPGSCPEDYDPECAVSRKGQWRVFVNHCRLDFNSCFYGEVWQRRPLTECVGGKKADLRQNRGFISWMQRVGIVNNKGKLTI